VKYSSVSLRRNILLFVVATLVLAALVVTALLTSASETQTAAKAGDVVAVAGAGGAKAE
jgi:multidrug resistance efflux pump